MCASSSPAASGSPAKPPTKPRKHPDSFTEDRTWELDFPATNRALQLGSELDGVAEQVDDGVVAQRTAKRRRRAFKFMPDATKERLQTEVGQSLDARQLNEMWIAMGADRQRAEIEDNKVARKKKMGRPRKQPSSTKRGQGVAPPKGFVGGKSKDEAQQEWDKMSVEDQQAWRPAPKKQRVPVQFQRANSDKPDKGAAAWESMSRSERSNWLAAVRVEAHVQETQRQRSIALPRKAGSGGVSVVAPQSADLWPRLKYTTVIRKYPELAEEFADEHVWKALGAESQREKVEACKSARAASATPRPATLSDAWAKDREDTENLCRRTSMLKTLSKKKNALHRLPMELIKFNVNAEDKVLAFNKTVANLTSLPPRRRIDGTLPAGSSLRASSSLRTLSFTFPQEVRMGSPMQPLRSVGGGAAATQDCDSQMQTGCVLNFNASTDDKRLALKCLAGGMSDAELESCGLSRAGVPEPDTAVWTHFDADSMRQAVSKSKQAHKS